MTAWDKWDDMDSKWSLPGKIISVCKMEDRRDH
jgi:hypothetical protein